MARTTARRSSATTKAAAARPKPADPRKPPKAKPLSLAKLTALARKQLGRPITLAAPDLELSARIPYAPAGRLDGLSIGQWDTEFNTVELDAAMGSELDLIFAPPAGGEYLIATNFTGYGPFGVRMTGPWGETTAGLMPGTLVGSALGIVSASGGASLNVAVRCLDPERGWGWVMSMQVHKLS